MILEKATKSDYPKVFELYNKSFPKHEKKPLWLLKKNLGKNYDLFVVKEEDLVAGFMIAVPVKDSNVVMFDYLAVNTDLRSKGYGTFILNEAVKYYDGKKVFLACETLDDNADNSEQRRKRYSFYERNGWKNTGLITKGSSGEMYLLAFEPITREEYVLAQQFACGKLLAKLGKLDAVYHEELDYFKK